MLQEINQLSLTQKIGKNVRGKVFEADKDHMEACVNPTVDLQLAAAAYNGMEEDIPTGRPLPNHSIYYFRTEESHPTESGHEWPTRRLFAMTAESQKERYQSMTAQLGIEDKSGTRKEIKAIMDRGAAWCAIGLPTLKREFPEHARHLSPAYCHFTDAQGHRIPMEGKLQMVI